ncbi:MAG: hypothetical protein HY721_30490 [Planctomycetes bacterium]|nr:hypothetical protein [Planctomycetota bacterium]
MPGATSLDIAIYTVAFAARILDQDGRPAARIGFKLEGPESCQLYADLEGRVAAPYLQPGTYRWYVFTHVQPPEVSGSGRLKLAGDTSVELEVNVNR